MRKKLETIWVISKYGSPKEYGVSSKPYRIAKYLSQNNINTYLISSDSNHLANYPKSTKKYNFEKNEELNHIWIKTLKYEKSASLKRILSWLFFEWDLFRLKKDELDIPDIVIISSLSLLTVLYGISLKRKYKCKLVFEVRDIYPLTFTEELGVSKHNPIITFFKYIEKLGYKKSDLIVGTMPNLCSHVRKVLGYDKNVLYSPLGINDSWNLGMESSKKVDALFPNDNKIIVGYAGSMGITNALESFIKTIQTLEKDEELYFVIVGQGDKKEGYIRELREYKNVTIGPKIEQHEIPYFLSKCDILYLSTKDSKVWDYGQSMNKLVDYMMAGKPVVASYSGYPSMLNEAESGVFVNTNSSSAIIEGLNKYTILTEEERKAIGERGRKWVIENHSNDIVCEKYMNRLIELFNEESEEESHANTTN